MRARDQREATDLHFLAHPWPEQADTTQIDDPSVMNAVRITKTQRRPCVYREDAPGFLQRPAERALPDFRGDAHSRRSPASFRLGCPRHYGALGPTVAQPHLVPAAPPLNCHYRQLSYARKRKSCPELNECAHSGSMQLG
ncbi:hypothetical protein D9M72_463880 [compost metagenome]